jgi:hypothetical protein
MMDDFREVLRCVERESTKTMSLLCVAAIAERSYRSAQRMSASALTIAPSCGHRFKLLEPGSCRDRVVY